MSGERYMMATRAVHGQVGELSRDVACLAVITGETDWYYVGRWAAGLGFVDVHFPKDSTRELTDAEWAYYSDKVIEVGGFSRALLGRGWSGGESEVVAAAAAAAKWDIHERAEFMRFICGYAPRAVLEFDAGRKPRT